jgi:hypothetical protein
MAAALAAFFLGSGLVVTATGADAFRPLVLGGSTVRWVAAGADNSPDAALVLRVGLVHDAMSFPGARNCARMVPLDDLLAGSSVTDAAFSRELDAALTMWSDATQVRFVRVAGAETADILVGAQAEPDGFAFTNVVPGRGEAADRIEATTICLNPLRRWKIGFDGNLDVFDLRYTLAHELGHALGLDHPSRSGQLMSYRYEEKFRELQPGDRAGISLLYGVHGSATANVAAASRAAAPTSLGIARD